MSNVVRGEFVQAPADKSQRKPTSARELERCEGGPLPTHRLAAIWQALPEDERLPFVHALDETVGDALIEYTARRAAVAALGGRQAA